MEEKNYLHGMVDRQKKDGEWYLDPVDLDSEYEQVKLDGYLVLLVGWLETRDEAVQEGLNTIEKYALNLEKERKHKSREALMASIIEIPQE